MADSFMETGSDELRSLRRGLSDLVALTTLPAFWAGKQPQEIAESLSDVLVTTILLDLVYIQMVQQSDGTVLELVRANGRLIDGQSARDTGLLVAPWLKGAGDNSQVTLPDPFGSGKLQAVINPIGYDGTAGYLVAGVRPPRTLTEIDHLLLRVAANQAVTALRHARLLIDMRGLSQMKDELLVQEQTARAKEQRAANRIILLQELTATLSNAQTDQDIADAILHTVLKLFTSETGAIYRMTESGDEMELVDGYNLRSKEVQQYHRLPLRLPSPLTDAVRAQSVVRVEHDEIVNRYPALIPLITEHQVRAIVAIPFMVEDRVSGGVVFSFEQAPNPNEEDIQLLMAIAQQCALAMERVRLSAQAKEMVAIAERQRLARELHDAVSQTLFAATIIAEGLPTRWKRTPEVAMEQLDQVVMLNRAAMGEMRTLLLELLPEAIINSTLEKLLRQLIAAARGRRDVEVELVIEGDESALPADVLLALYRIAQECINNVIKHSGATRFEMRLAQAPDNISMEVSDNGVGFDPTQAHSGLGMESMRERAEGIGAQLRIESSAGCGTVVRVEWADKTNSESLSGNR